MVRRIRFHRPMAYHHVMLRGNAGQPIFFSDVDRCRLCWLIQEGVERFGHRVHAFCLMKNHIHLALQVGDVSLSSIVQNLACRYARHVNRGQRRFGHLFQGRFKSILVDEEGYLKKLVRYIHLNPVRAGLSSSPEGYRWSSHRGYLSLDELTWLTRDAVLRQFGHDRSEAVASFASFVAAGIGLDEESEFDKGLDQGVLGDDDFVDRILEKSSAPRKPNIGLPTLVKRVCEHCGVAETTLCAQGKERDSSHARALLVWLARHTENLTTEEVARFLSREPSGVSKLAHRLEAQTCDSEPLAQELHTLNAWLVSQS